MYVAKNESVTAEEEALHIIAQKADGALRDALSIFDQVVSLCGRNIKYKDVIENLNVLDYEYYFRSVESALKGDVSAILLTFNEILEKGFDGHNFVAGLNSHMRDLLVSKDESTLRLLEASPAIRQRYLEQTGKCPADFLFRALDIGSNCDISYKTSKNSRLHIELSLIRMCRITAENGREAEKKKTDINRPVKVADDLSLPSKSEIIRQVEEPVKPVRGKETNPADKHMPVVEKPSRSISLKEIIGEEPEKTGPAPKASESEEKRSGAGKVEMNGETLQSAWTEFVENMKGEGPRIISMFKSIRPEMEDDHTIRIHLTNAAQKDLFVQNYKPKLSGFMENRFLVNELEIETSVDISETNELLYTDEQKYNYLVSKYPVIKDLKKNFNLDIP